MYFYNDYIRSVTQYWNSSYAVKFWKNIQKRKCKMKEGSKNMKMWNDVDGEWEEEDEEEKEKKRWRRRNKKKKKDEVEEDEKE